MNSTWTDRSAHSPTGGPWSIQGLLCRTGQRKVSRRKEEEKSWHSTAEGRLSATCKRSCCSRNASKLTVLMESWPIRVWVSSSQGETSSMPSENWSRSDWACSSCRTTWELVAEVVLHCSCKASSGVCVGEGTEEYIYIQYTGIYKIYTPSFSVNMWLEVCLQAEQIELDWGTAPVPCPRETYICS